MSLVRGALARSEPGGFVAASWRLHQERRHGKRAGNERSVPTSLAKGGGAAFVNLLTMLGEEALLTAVTKPREAAQYRQDTESHGIP